MLKMEDVSKVYHRLRGNSVTAVENLDLCVEAGQVFGLLGANGAGKTTVIKMACGLVNPTQGAIHINGENLLKNRSAAMTHIGAVLEGNRNIYWRMSAWENLMYFGRLKGCKGKGLRKRADFLLGEMGLWSRCHDKVRLFSRGLQQKVAIMCALIAEPPVILLDEPTLGLDLQSTRFIKEWIKELVKKEGKAVVLTTHQLNVARELCDQVAIIEKGKIIANRDINSLMAMFKDSRYEIRVKGEIINENPILQAANSEMSIESTDNGEIALVGEFSNFGLYKIIDVLRKEGLQLVSVNQISHSLEEIFIRIVYGEDRKAGLDI